MVDVLRSFSGSSLGPGDILPPLADSYMSPGRLHSGSIPYAHLETTAAHNVPVLCGPSCDLTVPLQNETWISIFRNVNFLLFCKQQRGTFFAVVLIWLFLWIIFMLAVFSSMSYFNLCLPKYSPVTFLFKCVYQC